MSESAESSRGGAIFQDRWTSTPFYKTRMGQYFYEKTVPDLVKQLARLNELLARVVDQQNIRDEEDR